MIEPGVQSTELAMEMVYGHKASFSTPLEVLVSRSPGDDKREKAWRSQYAEWLRSSEFGPLICFVDVTFAPVGARRTDIPPTTLVVSPFKAQVKEYRRRLNEDFFGRQISISAHKVFRNGLPRYLTSEGATKSAVEQKDLAEAQQKKWRLQDDGFLFWSAPGTRDEVGRYGLASPSSPFETDIDKTFPKDMRLDPKPNILECWEVFTDIFSRSFRAAPTGNDAFDEVGIMVGAPIGIRDHHDRYTGVAQVFFGLSKRAGKTDATDFLRMLAVHLLRSNAGFNQQVRGSRMLLEIIGHELRKVMQPATTTWIPEAADIFDVSVAETEKASLPAAPDKLGKIVLNPNAQFLLSTLGIVPFTPYVRSIASATNFWSYSDYLQDLPFANNFPRTWAEMIVPCWETARNWMIIYALSKYSADTTSRIHELYERVMNFRQLLKPLEVAVSFEPSLLGETPLHYVQGANHKRSFALTRLLVACFNNALQHGDLCRPVEVRFRKEWGRDGSITLTIVNGRHQSDIQKIAERSGLSTEVAATLLQALEANRLSRKNFDQHIGSTAEVIAMSLDALDGFTLDMEPTDSEYYASFSFPAWEGM